MRITTKVIQNNSLHNINTNKLLQDKLSQQMSTEKKVNRPSDDPIVAIRALRLRTNVNQVTQYYEKNVPDAESWLEVTEGALSSMSEVITDMIHQATKGSNEDLKLEDREVILTALEKLRDEVYSTGNSDYAGRYIFTGYRTDTPLTFTEDTTKEYAITEQLQNDIIDSVTYVETGNILELNESNYNSNTPDPNTNIANDEIAEQQISTNTVHRIRLSYKDIDTIDKTQNPVPAENYEIQIWSDTGGADGTGGHVKLTEVPVTDINGTVTQENVVYESASLYDEPSPYSIDFSDPANANKVVIVKETGEMLLGQNVYDKLMSLQDDPTTKADEGEFRVTYCKSEWEEGDLRPEHYFACTEAKTDPVTGVAVPIEYNQNYLDGIEEKQAIEYDVGLNQTIRVNTTADEAFSHKVTRDMDDLIRCMEQTIAMEKQVMKLQEMVEKTTDPDDKKILENQLAAAQKAFTFLKEDTQVTFESRITKLQESLDEVNFAVTENGTRGQKLELISNRLMSQKTNFETLKSENEDIDITDVAIKLSSAELTYSSALMATGKVLQNNLMNFI